MRAITVRVSHNRQLPKGGHYLGRRTWLMITYRVEGETRDFNAFAMKHVLINFIYSLIGSHPIHLPRPTKEHYIAIYYDFCYLYPPMRTLNSPSPSFPRQHRIMYRIATFLLPSRFAL